MVELPQKKKNIDVKWIFKVKLNPNGTLSKHKVRLVAGSFSQRYNIDYSEVFALVAKIEIALASNCINHPNLLICSVNKCNNIITYISTIKIYDLELFPNIFYWFNYLCNP